MNFSGEFPACRSMESVTRSQSRKMTTSTTFSTAITEYYLQKEIDYPNVPRVTANGTVKGFFSEGLWLLVTTEERR